MYTSSFNRPTNTDDLQLEEGRTDIEDILENAPAPTIPKVDITPVDPGPADVTPTNDEILPE